MSVQSSSITTLKQALMKENCVEENTLSTLEKGFYKNMAEYINTLLESEKVSVLKLLNRLIAKRKAKIIKFATTIELSKDIESKLTEEETQFYNSIYSLSDTFYQSLNIGI